MTDTHTNTKRPKPPGLTLKFSNETDTQPEKLSVLNQEAGSVVISRVASSAELEDPYTKPITIPAGKEYLLLSGPLAPQAQSSLPNSFVWAAGDVCRLGNGSS